MADGGFRNIYADGPAIRVTDIDKPAPPRPPAKRRVTGEREKIDKFERLLPAVSSGAFWACVAYLVGHVATCPKEGRPREHTIAEWALFWLLSDIAGGLRPSDDVLARLTNWDEARSVVESMGWDHPEMKLSDKAIDRHKYYRFRGRCIGDDQITELGRIISAHAVRDARALGQFGHSGGSRATVSPEHGVYGDGCQMPTRFDARHKRVDSDTGEVTYSRHDPDAIAHHHHLWAEDPESGDVRCKICDSNRRQATTGSGSDGPQIHEAVTLLTRADERQGRLILGIGLRHAHQTDANLFTDMVLDLKHNNPSLSDAALMCVYDQRLNATDFDRLHDDGNIPIRKVGHDPGGRKKVRVLHDQPFELADGTKAAHDVHDANGTPSLRVHDADGAERLIETVRTKTQTNRLKNSRVIYCERQVADHALAGDLAGATARIRHTTAKNAKSKRADAAACTSESAPNPARNIPRYSACAKTPNPTTRHKSGNSSTAASAPSAGPETPSTCSRSR